MDQLTYAILYLELNITSVVLVLIILYKTSGLSRMVAQRNFVMAIYAQMAFFISDTLCVMMKSGVMPDSAFFTMFFKSVYFFSTALMCYFWFLYFEYMQESQFILNKRRVRLSSCFVWIMGVLLIVNIFNGIFFRVDPDGTYVRGPLFILQYVLSYVYVFFTCTRALIGVFDKKKYAKRQLLIRLALFPVAPAAAGIVQFIRPELPLACVTLSLATLYLYLGWIDQIISLDPLTKLNNRKRFTYFYSQWLSENENDESLYLMMIDADHFKSINDTYGHAEGDMALIRVAEALRQSCSTLKRKYHIARYGGDEFAVFVRDSSDIEMKMLMSKISDTLAGLNSNDDSPYDLTVSMGYFRAEGDMPLKSLIEEADKRLYENKKTHHSEKGKKPT